MTYQSDKEPSPADDLSQHVKSRSTWLRFVFMLLFALIFYVSEIVLFAVAGVQFLFVLFSGATSGRLTAFGANLSRYIHQIAQFLTYNSDVMPFPFTDWPDEEPGE